MTENKDRKYEAEGILSFIKGCDDLFFGQSESGSNWKLFQYSTSPTVYTKLYCFLPWIADQYDLEYTFTYYDKVSPGSTIFIYLPWFTNCAFLSFSTSSSHKSKLSSLSFLIF